MKYEEIFMHNYEEKIRAEERPKAFANGYESGYKQGRADAIDKIYRYVKTNCNPYGKPSLEYESGVKILNYLEQLKENNK